MKKRLLKFILFVLFLILIKEVILIIITNYNNKKIITSYFNNDTSFNYKSDFIIEIPKINLNTYIKKADDDFKNLNKSLVYYKYNNYKEKIIVFGHSGVGYGVYFNRLDELVLKDLVYLYYDNLKISYIVIKKYSIKKTEIDILNNDRKGILLLVTCKKNNRNERLVVELMVNDVQTLRK